MTEEGTVMTSIPFLGEKLLMPKNSQMQSYHFDPITLDLYDIKLFGHRE